VNYCVKKIERRAEKENKDKEKQYREKQEE